jgi:xyloglucan-specific exo-beta-1,4-glucanase
MNILSGSVRPILRLLPVVAVAALVGCASNSDGGGSAGGGSQGGSAGTSGGHGGSAGQDGVGGAASGSGGTLGSAGGVSGGSAGTAGGSGVSGSAGAAGSSGSAGAAGGPPVTGPYKWRGVAFGGGGFVSAVIPSLTEKNLFFARTDVGGLFRWNEADASWVQLTGFVSDSQTGFLGVESVALDPQVPGRVYALVGIDYFNGGKTAILRSTNNGDSFTVTEVTSQFKAHGNGMGRQNGERLAVDPNLSNVLFCGTRRSGLFKSSDSGATWSQVASFPVTTTANDNGISLVLFDKSSSTAGTATKRIYAGVSRLGQANFYVSADAGATWNEVAGAPSTSQMPQRAALASNGTLFVTFADGAGPNGNSGSEPMSAGSIWKYAIAQASWTNITPAGATSAFSGIDVSAANPNQLVATSINKYLQQPWGYGDRIYASSDGGSSWTDLIGSNKVTMDVNGMSWIANHAIHWAGSATFDPNDAERVFVTSGNGIFSTSNLSATTSTWKFLTKGLEETVALEAVSIPGGGFGFVIGDYDGAITQNVTVSPPSGIYNPSMGSTGALAVAGSKPAVLVRGGTKIYRTTNGGAAWTEVARPNTQTDGRVALSADGAVLLWTPDKSVTTYRTPDAGGSWAAVTGIDFNAAVVADAVNANKFYAYDTGSGNVLVSTDGGGSFSQASKPGAGGSTKPRTVPGVEGDIWIPLNGGGLSRSTNSGATFSKLPDVSQCNAVGFGKAASGASFPTVFIWGKVGTGVVGIYRSIDAGATWLRINDDQHQFGGPGNGQFIVGDLNVSGRVYMSTAGLGIVYGEPN